MKRSEINTIMRRADEFIRQQNFRLPPFAYWTPEEWKHKGPEVREIVQNKLGWDITDFGSGDFPNTSVCSCSPSATAVRRTGKPCKASCMPKRS